MSVETGDKAIPRATGTDDAVGPPFDFTAVTAGSEQLFSRTDTTSAKLPDGMTSSADLLGRDLSNLDFQVASLGGNFARRPEAPISDAQLMLQLTDPEIKAQRDQMLSNPTEISEALKRVSENPNDPANIKTAQALQILRLDMQNAGFKATLDLGKGELSLTKADLDTGESQTINFDRNGTDRNINDFADRTIEPPLEDLKPTTEMSRRESRINASLDRNNLNPLLHAVKDLQQTIERMGDRESPLLQARIEQLGSMLDRVASGLSGDNPFHPVKAELTESGKFEFTLTGSDKLSISPDGTVQIDGRSVKPDSKEVADFLARSTRLRRLTTNEFS